MDGAGVRLRWAWVGARWAADMAGVCVSINNTNTDGCDLMAMITMTSSLTHKETEKQWSSWIETLVGGGVGGVGVGGRGWGMPSEADVRMIKRMISRAPTVRVYRGRRRQR